MPAPNHRTVVDLDWLLTSKTWSLITAASAGLVVFTGLSLLGIDQRFNVLVVLCAMLGLGPVLMFHVYRRDMRERQSAERSLRESEERYRRLIEFSPTAIGVHEDGRILYTNPAWAKLIGANSPDEVVGRQLLDFFHAEFHDGVAAALAQLGAGEGAPIEQRLVRKDGAALDVEICAAPLFHDGKQSVQILIRDISERKRTEAELAKALQLAQQATQLKSEFLTNMSHELRTPMNGVLGMADVLLATRLTEEQKEYAEIILTSAKSLMTLLNEILDLSRIEAGKTQLEIAPLDLDAVLTEVLNLFSARAAAKKLTLSASRSELVPSRLEGDAARIRQILTNLVDNAIKFTERGNISVRVDCEGILDGSTKLRVVVEDSGIGIPADRQKRIFDKFEQVDASITRKYGGTGLGLAICQQLVELMGGTIGVYSLPQRGSQFWFTLNLPVADEEAPMKPPARERSPRTSRGIRILLVEDDKTNQRVALRMLEKLGCQVEIAATGKEAVLMARRGFFDLVLMDCDLPGMSGIDATRWIRADEADGQHVPIVALTAHAMKEDRNRCLQAGMDDYLAKPIEIANLSRALNHWAQIAYRSKAADHRLPQTIARENAGH